MTISIITSNRVDQLIKKANKTVTKDALRKCLMKPTRADWLAAEKLAWADVPLDTNDCLWLRSQGLAQPGKGSGEATLRGDRDD